MTQPDAVALRRTWTRRTADDNKQYSDWHLIDVIAQAGVRGTLISLCGGKLPPERTERPGDTRTLKRVCPPCVQALMAAQRPKHGW